jgi:hypothetical protein
MRLTFIGINISLRYTPMLFIETGTFIDPKFYTFMESAIGVVNSTGSGEEVDLLAWADDIHRDVGIWYPSERISIASSDFLMVGLDPSWSVEFNFWDGALLIDGYLESRWDALAQHPHARAICSRLLCNRYIRHNEPTEPTYARLSAFLDETFTKTAANALEHIGRNEGESDKISTQVSWDASSAMDDQHVIANLATAAIDNLDWAMRRASYEFSAVFALLQRQNTFVGRSQLSPGPRERFTLHIQVPLRTSWKPLRLRASRSAVRSPGYPTHYRLICLVNHRGMLRADWTPCTGVVVGKYDVESESLGAFFEIRIMENRRYYNAGFPLYHAFVGTQDHFEHCLEDVKQEVWANRNCQLDAWQQLCMLACVKKCFKHFWTIITPETHELAQISL